MRTFFWFIFLFLPMLLHAQPQGGVYGLGVFPTGTFNSNYRNGIGFGFEFLSADVIKYIPGNAANKVTLRGGAGFSFTSFGREKFELELAAPQTGMANVKIRNAAFGFTPVLRAGFGNGKIQPYVEGFCGWNFYSSTQVISPKKQSRNSEFENETEEEIHTSNAFYYGVSAGNLIRLNDELYANIGLSYALGENAKILPLNSIEKNGNELKYKLVNTPTDMLMLKFGLTFYLNPGPVTFSHGPGTNSNTPNNRKPNVLKKNDRPVQH